MTGDSAQARTKCINCGFETRDSTEWLTAEHPQLGALAQCPECESTNTTTIG